MCVYVRELTPIEEASRLNQKLKANYEARLARLTPGQATQKTSLVSLKKKISMHIYAGKKMCMLIYAYFRKLIKEYTHACIYKMEALKKT